MEQSGTNFKTFEDLEVYREARSFRKAMYMVARKLPDIEKFGLCSQIRRAAVSLTNNLAEGHGRYHYPDRIKFSLQARGSLEELIDDLNVCIDEKYISLDQIETLKQQAWRVLHKLNAYMRFLRNQHLEKNKPVLHESPPPYVTESEDPFDPAEF